MSKPNQNKMIENVENAKTCNAMDYLGFVCLEQASYVLGDPTEEPEVWVWTHKNGAQVTMYDEGNDKCSFVAWIKMPEIQVEPELELVGV